MSFRRLISHPIGLTAAIAVALFAVWLAVVFVEFCKISEAIFGLEIIESHDVNARGDVIASTTDLHGDGPWRIVVSLRRASGWFSTELMATTCSGDSRVGVRWRDDDHALVAIACDGERAAGREIAEVGPIHFDYAFPRLVASATARPLVSPGGPCSASGPC